MVDGDDEYGDWDGDRAEYYDGDGDAEYHDFDDGVDCGRGADDCDDEYNDIDNDDGAFACSNAAAVKPMEYATLIYMPLDDGTLRRC